MGTHEKPTVTLYVWTKDYQDDIYFLTMSEARDWKRERGGNISKAGLGAGHTPRELVANILNGKGFISSMEDVA